MLANEFQSVNYNLTQSPESEVALCLQQNQNIIQRVFEKSLTSDHMFTETQWHAAHVKSQACRLTAKLHF